MKKILTFKNDRSSFSIENVDSISFSSLKAWVMCHCTLDDSSSDNIFVLKNDDSNQTRLKGCRLYAMKEQKLKVSTIAAL